MKMTQCLFFALLAFTVGCGPAEISKSTKAMGAAISQNPVKENKRDTIKPVQSTSNQKLPKMKPVRSKVVRSDSTFYIEFYDENGTLTGIYDFWENNPYNLPDFEKYDDTPGHYPMRYKVPGLTNDQLKGKVPDELLRNMDEGVHIGRLDVFIHYPYNLESCKTYTPVLYQLNAMEGYDEEYEVPASFGVINILNDQGEIWKSVRVEDSGWGSPAVTQDGKYLVYKRIIPNKETGGCFDVYDLRKNKVVYTKCVEIGFELNGAFLHSSNIAGIGIYHSLKRDTSISVLIDSRRESIFFKVFDFEIGSWELTPKGLVVSNRKTKKVDTLFFINDFETINLYK